MIDPYVGFRYRKGVKPLRLFIIGTTLILLGCDRKKAEAPHFTEPSRNTAVDVIDGFKSIKLGESRPEIEKRLEGRMKRWTAGEDRPDDAIYEVTPIAEEQEWGGVPMSIIKVEVQRGVVTEVSVEFDRDFVLLENALRKKYGNPTDINRIGDSGVEKLPTDHDPDDWRGIRIRWEGDDTIMTMDDPSKFRVTFEKKSVRDRNYKAEQDEQAAQRNKLDSRAAEASKKL